MAPISDNSALAHPPAIVLDTNVVLDWLVFEDPCGLTIGTSVASGQLLWVGTSATLQELAFVLERPALARWAQACKGALARAERLCRLVAGLPPHAGAHMRCSDADDQKFIDLALAYPAMWLVSHDKAVLRLTRRAGARGLRVMTPARWCATAAPALGQPPT